MNGQMNGRILVTGGDGYLGRRIAGRLLSQTDDRLTLAVRAVDGAELAAKEESLRRELGRVPGFAEDRVDVVAADVRRHEPFAAVDPGGVTSIVHAAACTELNVERSVAREVNVEGTRRLADFAHGCPRLERLVVLSTLFSSGRRVGTVAEAAHGDDPGFVNHYEWSKHETERNLLATCADLPLSIVRLATIVADDDAGTVTQYNAFHNTLKLFFYGFLSLMPGKAGTRLYFATADFTSRGVVHLLRPAAPAGVYHLAPSPEEAITLGELTDAVFDAFEADPAFRRRRLPRPDFCDLESFRDVVGASRSLPAAPTAKALISVVPFAEQMFLPKDFDNSRLRAAWADCPAAESRRLVEATCMRLVRTRWGRKDFHSLEGAG